MELLTLPQGKKRYSLHLSYIGTAYRGWQRQPDVMTVQECIETALSKILKRPHIINGCGRTDAGVHASQYFAHFDTEQEWDLDLLFILNKILPEDISIHDIIPCTGIGDHTRYHAIRRSYKYFIHTQKIAHLSQSSTLVQTRGRNGTLLDFKTMQMAAAMIPDYKDFIAFCKSPSAHKSTDCKIQSVSLSRNKTGTQFCFEIAANRFLRGMVRSIVARIILVGSGDLSLESFERALKNELGGELPTAAPPQGLYLSQVVYPFMDVKPVLDLKAVMLVTPGDAWIE